MHYLLRTKLEMGIKKSLVAIIPITESLVVLHGTISCLLIALQNIFIIWLSLASHMYCKEITCTVKKAELRKYLFIMGRVGLCLWKCLLISNIIGKLCMILSLRGEMLSNFLPFFFPFSFFLFFSFFFLCMEPMTCAEFPLTMELHFTI